MEEGLRNIIRAQFNKDFFSNGPDASAIGYIKNCITEFQNSYPKITQTTLTNLNNIFAKAQIENFTHFFDYDRCLRFLIQISEERRYIMQISIFRVFSVYQHSAFLKDGKYFYGDLRFIDKNECEDGILIFSALKNNYNEFTWLKKAFLEEVLPEFSIPNEDKRFSQLVTVADALFTSHYV